MKLEHLCDMELAYREESFGKFVLVRPYGGQEGSGYGEGDGVVRGARLSGRVRWVNHPRRRSDGAMLPDAHGIIQTNDGTQVLFSLHGRTVWVDAGGRRKGRQVLMVLFEADDERYRWLNASVCILEGVIDPEALTTVMPIYVCVNELV